MFNFRLDEVSSPKYREVLRASHASVKAWGTGGKGHIATIQNYADEIGAKTLLDYGCGHVDPSGHAALARALKDVKSELDVREYDPGILGKDALPEPADMVVATDVLEHIEPELVYNVIRHIRELAGKGGFLIIALSKAKFTLTDGRNAHLTIMPAVWWVDQLVKSGFTIEKQEVTKGLRVWFR